ncbi:plasmid recombination protein [Paracoccus shanxieyensis]|uniref:Plasmid recombination enzyme n=1 Tax=Paracoccus shanxieyensis TaxID=2675752 RepID=A0A6L6J658_9RHOB|nr:plasmid recombination protein [Paracoccus shanxieyensis]MTH66174.1 hypothetical protein [Paracoccus shanxieyensis]MTH89437.1 hypothetical protein [Paracoccus shanxieyensis]
MAKPPRNHKSPEGNPKAASTRLELKNVRSLAGQRKHDLRIGRQPDYIDEIRKSLNRIIMEPDPPGAMRTICEGRRSLRETRRKMKKDAAVAACGIITFGTEAADLFEALTPEAQDAAFLDLAESVAERLNTTLHGLVVHMDETTIHAHFQLAAYNRDGVPLSQATRPAVMSGLQDLTAEVMARHCAGIERGHRYGDRIAAGADFKDTLHRTVRELHTDLPREIAAKRADLAEASARADEMRARVQKLENKAELTDKETKRLETYRARLAERVAVEEAAQAEAERLTRIALDEAEQARRERDAAKTEEEASRIKAARITSAIQVLADEIRDETIGRGESGNVEAHNPEGLRQGFPDLKPAVIATADAMTAKKRLEAAAQADRDAATRALAEAEVARREAFNLRSVMKKTLGLLKLTLSRVGRHLTATEKADAADVVAEAERLITPPKKPRDGSGSDFSM